jgi:DNA-binding NtrC family response regulator
MLDAVPHNVCIVDTSGIIVHVNRAWVMFGRANGLALPNDGLGTNYLELCAAPSCPRTTQTARAVAAGLRTVLRSGHGRFTLSYAAEEPGHAEGFWQVTIIPAQPTGALIQHQDVTVQRQEERRRAVELAVAERIVQEAPGPGSRSRLLTAVAGAAGWDGVLVWRPDAGDGLTLSSHWRADPRSKLSEPPADSRLGPIPGRGLALQAAREGAPCWTGPLEEQDQALLDLVFGPQHGLASAFAVPFPVAGERRIAVFYGPLPARPDRGLLELVAQVLSEDRTLRRPSVLVTPRRSSPSDRPSAPDALPAEAHPGGADVRMIERGAATDLPMLVEGEVGTGKRMLAETVHRASPRARGPFRVVELPEAGPGELEAALRACRGGTLLLRHVDQLDLPEQERLLVFLDTSDRGRGADVRLVATSRVPLRRAAEAGAFLEELYVALNVVEVRLAPLRERPWEIPERIAEVLQDHRAEARGISLGRDAERALRRHAWPGNVGELRRFLGALVDRSPDGARLGEVEVVGALRRTGGGLARATDLGDSTAGEPAASASQGTPPEGRGTGTAHLRSLERAHVERVLAETGFNMRRAAEALGISRSTLYEKARKYGIDLAAQRARARAEGRRANPRRRRAAE